MKKLEKGKLSMMDWVIPGDSSRWDLGELGLTNNGVALPGLRRVLTH
jgi:hypothetical protein